MVTDAGRRLGGTTVGQIAPERRFAPITLRSPTTAPPAPPMTAPAAPRRSNPAMPTGCIVATMDLKAQGLRRGRAWPTPPHGWPQNAFSGVGPAYTHGRGTGRPIGGPGWSRRSIRAPAPVPSIPAAGAQRIRLSVTSGHRRAPARRCETASRLQPKDVQHRRRRHVLEFGRASCRRRRRRPHWPPQLPAAAAKFVAAGMHRGAAARRTGNAFAA
jgi:hypothetical protein